MDANEKIENIYKEHYKLMLYVAYQRTKDPALAEDVVSEAFIKIMRHIDKFENIYSNQTKGYIVKIVGTTSLDMLRKINKSNVIDASDEVMEDIPDVKVNILEGVLAKDGYSTIKDAIKALPDTLKDVVYLSLVSGHNHDEISQILGISYSASKKRLFNARKILKKKLGDLYGRK